MSARVLHRVQRLERAAEPPGSCAMCGGPDAPREYTVGWHINDDVDDEPTHCPGCGRRQVFHIEFDKRG